MIDYSTEDNNEKSGYYDRRRNINDKQPMIAAMLPLFNFSSVVICRSLAYLLDPANNLASSCTLHAPCCILPDRQHRGEERRGVVEWWNWTGKKIPNCRIRYKMSACQNNGKKVYPPKIAPTSTFNLRIIKIFLENENSSPKSLTCDLCSQSPWGRFFCQFYSVVKFFILQLRVSRSLASEGRLRRVSNSVIMCHNYIEFYRQYFFIYLSSY